MQKNPSSKSGFFNPRVILALVLCSVGASLAILGTASPTPSSKTAAQGSSQPVVSMSVAHGVSPAVTDLPVTAPTARTFEHELPPVHPKHPVPPGFVDHAVQTSLGALAMPTPINTFEGQSADDSGCGCIPPDT